MNLSIIYKNFIEPVVSIALPALCVFCQSQLEAERKVVCKQCFDKLPHLPLHFIDTLKDEINSAYFEDLYVVYQFNPEFKTLIHLLKYNRFLTIAKYFAKSLAATVDSQRYDFVTGVPLHPIKERERGYNQSFLIAGHVGSLLNIPFNDKLIRRVKNTASQTTLNRDKRIENVKQAFVSKRDLQNKRILLIDDVITTGNTLDACAQVLKQQGAIRVDLAALSTPMNFLQNSLEIEPAGLQIF